MKLDACRHPEHMQKMDFSRHGGGRRRAERLNTRAGSIVLILLTMARALVMFAMTLVVAFAAAAAAEDVIVITEAEEAIVITEADCRLLVRHVPAADVAYEPGVDVRGNAVAPADLGAPEISLPEEISIDVTALVYDLLKTTPPTGLKDTAINLGKVVFRDGRLTYNGQPLGDAADATLIAVCRERGF